MILEDLYFRNTETSKMPPEYRDILHKLGPYQEKIRETLGYSFLDEYATLNTRLSSISEAQSFRSGVQFAVRFLLETLL